MFVRRSLCGLPLLLAQFSSSLPMFLKSETYGTDGVISQWNNETKAAVFPMMLDTPMIGNVEEYCLASLVFHQSIVESLPISHPLRSSSIFRLPAVCELETAGTHTKVLYP